MSPWGVRSPTGGRQRRLLQGSVDVQALGKGAGSYAAVRELHEGHHAILARDRPKQHPQDAPLGTAGLMPLSQTQGV